MATENIAESAPIAASEKAQKAAFFRQGGWMMISGIGGGALMWAVHFLSKGIPDTEYGIFGTMLALMMFLPTMPLQMIFAQQTAKSLASNRERELSGMIRMGTFAIVGLWLLAAIGLLLFQKDVSALWSIKNPQTLWITLGVLLLTVLNPVFNGLLQGKQNFLWFGWAVILSSLGRISGAAFLVLVLKRGAEGIMLGVLTGALVAVAIGVWQTRSLWLARPQPFDWRSLVTQIAPLMLGYGAFQFLFTADTMFVQHYFPELNAYYVSAGTFSRALLWLVGPLAAVMFPRIVQSAVRNEKSNLLGLTLAATGALLTVGAVGLWVLGPWVVKFVNGKETFVKNTVPLLPWYTAAVIPLALANVLLNNLFARARFRIVPVLVVLAVAYGVALTLVHGGGLLAVLKTLGAFNLILFAVSAWFTWGPGSASDTPRTPGAT